MFRATPAIYRASPPTLRTKVTDPVFQTVILASCTQRAQMCVHVSGIYAAGIGLPVAVGKAGEGEEEHSGSEER